MCRSQRQRSQQQGRQNQSRWKQSFALIALLFIAGAGVLHANTDDTQQPIHIEADRAEISESQGVMTYTGHVVLSQGGIEVRADSVIVFAKEGEVQRIIAEGQPVHYRQQRLNEQEVRGVSQRMEYTAANKQVLLLGQAEFWQGENRFSGNRIQYDPQTERVVANAGTEGGADMPQQRVTVTLQPRSKEQKTEDTQGLPEKGEQADVPAFDSQKLDSQKQDPQKLDSPKP